MLTNWNKLYLQVILKINNFWIPIDRMKDIAWILWVGKNTSIYWNKATKFFLLTSVLLPRKEMNAAKLATYSYTKIKVYSFGEECTIHQIGSRNVSKSQWTSRALAFSQIESSLILPSWDEWLMKHVPNWKFIITFRMCRY